MKDDSIGAMADVAVSAAAEEPKQQDPAAEAAEDGSTAATPSAAVSFQTREQQVSMHNKPPENASSVFVVANKTNKKEESVLDVSTEETLQALETPEEGAAAALSLAAAASFDTTDLVPLSDDDGGDDNRTNKLPTTSVSPERKRALLLQARRDRLQWIQQVPLPYRQAQGRQRAVPTEQSQKQQQQPGEVEPAGDAELLSTTLLASSHVGLQLPSALSLLSHLYSSSTQAASEPEEEPSLSTTAAVGDHVNALVRQQQQEQQKESLTANDDNDLAMPTGLQKAKAELARVMEEENSETAKVLQAYLDFWKRLQEPAGAALVQGMRNFCRHVCETQSSPAKQLQTYLASTQASLTSHVLWKTMNGNDDDDDKERWLYIRRSLESFIFAQCYSHLETVVENKKGDDDTDSLSVLSEPAWMERLSSLQFITPEHLEIDCLVAKKEDEKVATTYYDLDDLLREPMEALLSVDLYFSAFEKLQRILAVYHGVNTALSRALNAPATGRDASTAAAAAVSDNKDNSNNNHKRLPSADDVLPTIILTVIRARPANLQWNLKFVEEFSPPEYLRGEAGYAFTNLYGAVQFLQDLDLEEPSSLSITPEDFRKGLEACRMEAKQRLENTTDTEQDVLRLQNEPSSLFRPIPPHEIREARRRGEDLNLEWAIQWQQEHTADGSTDIDGLLDGGTMAATPQRAAIDEVMLGLPPGFARTYSFLNKTPEDIKVTDLPQLLSEYRMLVQVTETLIGQRAAKATAERKTRRLSTQKDLFSVVRQVDPSLLSSVAGSKSS